MRRGQDKIPVFFPGDDRAGAPRSVVSAKAADAWVRAGLVMSIKGKEIVLLRAPEYRLRDVSARMNGRDIEDFVVGKRKVAEALEVWSPSTLPTGTERGP